MSKVIRFKNFAILFQNAAEKGILLVLFGVFALIMANSEFSAGYFAFMKTHISLSVADFSLSLSMHHFINDFLMAIFFFAVGLEIKRELIDGHLSSFEQRILPFAAAVGGALFPVLIFILFNFGDADKMRGWAIPSATDIAFALGMLALFGKGLPVSLRVFLTALAIIDDLFAIIIIALFYSADISVGYIGFIVLLVGILVVMNRLKVASAMAYCAIGLLIWYMFYKSGIHATVGGVILGFAIPLRGAGKDGLKSPLKNFEKVLHPYVSFLILPLFAFANVGIILGPGMSLTSSVALGCLFGLLFGKQIGVFLLSFILFKKGVCKLPEGANIMQFYGVCILCGIGFTMSIFIAVLGYEDHYNLLNEAKLGVIIGSVISAVMAGVILKLSNKKTVISAKS